MKNGPIPSPSSHTLTRKVEYDWSSLLKSDSICGTAGVHVSVAVVLDIYFSEGGSPVEEMYCYPIVLIADSSITMVHFRGLAQLRGLAGSFGLSNSGAISGGILVVPLDSGAGF